MSKKKIGVLCTEPVPLLPEIVGAGGGLRALSIGKKLEGTAEVIYLFPEMEGVSFEGLPVVTFPEKSMEIETFFPELDLLIAVQWPVLNRIKNKPDCQIVTDLLGPLMLENSSNDSFQPGDLFAAKMEALRKSDRFLVASKRQKAYFLSWLAMAGFALNEEDLITELPLFFEDLQPMKFHKDLPLNFVFCGYFWPWQNAAPFLNELAAMAGKHGDRMTIIGGPHPYWKNFPGEYYHLEELKKHAHVRFEPVMPFEKLDKLLTENCIGIDLCQPTYERQISTPIKTAFYLGKKMPVLVSSCYEQGAMINGKLGWSFDCSNVEAFSKKLNKLYSHFKDGFVHKQENIVKYHKVLKRRVASGLDIEKILPVSSGPANSPYLSAMDEFARLKYEHGRLWERSQILLEEANLKNQITKSFKGFFKKK